MQSDRRGPKNKGGIKAMRKIRTRAFSILLTCAMLLSLLPVTALAGETTDAGTITVGEKTHSSFSDAVNAAEPDGGVITYEISGKVDVTATGWVQVAKAGLTGLSKVEFIGKTDDAEICITQGAAILADQSYGIDVSFEKLKLTKLLRYQIRHNYVILVIFPQ